MFIGPLIAASITYIYRDSFSFTAKSFGTLVTPTPITLQRLYDTKLQPLTQTNNSNKWLLIYIAKQPCATICKQELQLVHNTHIALHKYSDTVMPGLAYLSDINISLQQLQPGNIIIVDPRGNYIMRYAEPITAINAKAIIIDLKKLVKFPHVADTKQ
ncbi:MAG: hypothetical protein COC15_04575 [Legionellales bacterium]|nr:MAG: hypothetical protein COC15_04575 [Legionellales bacterium]